MTEDPVNVAMIVSDEREVLRDYSSTTPSFGFAPDSLLQGFAQTPDCRVHVICCLQHPVVSPSELDHNITFHPLIVPKRGWLRSGYLGCVMAIRKKVRHLKAHIVHGQGTERYCALSASCSGRPNVITIHGNMRRLAVMTRARPFSFPWLHARLEQFVLPRTMGVLCNSGHTERLIRPVARRVWRVPNPLHSCYFLPIVHGSPKAPLFLNIGTVSPLKQQIRLLQSLEALHAQSGGFEVEFLGRVDRSSTYGSQFLSEMGRSTVKRFARYSGFQKPGELVRHLDSASALIHVSQEESFGLVIAEALARNLKVFAFKAGAVEEIAGGVDGVELLEPGDWNGLCQRVHAWMQAGCRRPTAAAAEMRDRYSPVIVARRHLEVYRDLLATLPGH